MDGNGGTNYLTNAIQAGGPTSTSVPVQVTVTTNPAGGGSFSGSLGITVVLDFN